MIAIIFNEFPGEIWQLTNNFTTHHFLNPNEILLKSNNKALILKKNEFIYINNPYDENTRKNDFKKVIILKEIIFLNKTEIIEKSLGGITSSS